MRKVYKYLPIYAVTKVHSSNRRNHYFELEKLFAKGKAKQLLLSFKQRNDLTMDATVESQFVAV